MAIVIRSKSLRFSTLFQSTLSKLNLENTPRRGQSRSQGGACGCTARSDEGEYEKHERESLTSPSHSHTSPPRHHATPLTRPPPSTAHEATPRFIFLVIALSTVRETNKSNGGETVTPYSNDNIFSILTFSWMGPLISTGYKKTLDLEDIHQLDSVDSVNGSYPVLKNKLDSDANNSSGGVTTLRLVKALILTTWKEILLTAILVALYTTAIYVGPYLIDTFVQYFNGRREFENEGYLLVSAFVVAKLVECFLHWYTGTLSCSRLELGSGLPWLQRSSARFDPLM
ncbi:hypothetical protein LguiA_035687 [Lonicera macranthoides]